MSPARVKDLPSCLPAASLRPCVRPELSPNLPPGFFAAGEGQARRKTQDARGKAHNQIGLGFPVRARIGDRVRASSGSGSGSTLLLPWVDHG